MINKTIKDTYNQDEVDLLRDDMQALEKELAREKDKVLKLEEDSRITKTRLRERDMIEEEYIRGVIVTGTTSGSVGTQTTHSHNLGRKPKFTFITPKSNGTVYVSSDADATNIYIKGSDASLDFEAYCLL